MKTTDPRFEATVRALDQLAAMDRSARRRAQRFGIRSTNGILASVRPNWREGTEPMRESHLPDQNPNE